MNKLWKRINYFLILAMCVVGAVLMYFDLKPAFENIANFFDVRFVYVWAIFSFAFFVMTLVLTVVSNRKLNAKSVTKLFMFSLLSPAIVCPIMFVIELKFGFALFVLLFFSVILQRIDWKQTAEYVHDAKIAFSPHLKLAFNDFVELREKRKFGE